MISFRTRSSVSAEAEEGFMEGHATYQPKGRFAKWFESRLPVIGLVHSSFVVFTE